MKRLIARLIRDEQAQDLVEYALLAGFMAVACITGILELSRIKEFFEDIGVILRTAL